MSRILSYKAFEGKEEENQIEYFNRILDTTPEGKDFQKWFDSKPVRTGRFYIKRKTGTEENKGISIPSKSYFDLGYSGNWYYEFSSANGSYGRTNGDLKDLLREFIMDAIVKCRPSSIQKKKIEEYLSKESNAPKGNFPSPQKIYDSVLGESGFVQDFSFLSDLLPVKAMQDLGLRVITGKPSLYFSVPYSPLELITRILGEEEMKEILDNSPEIKTSLDFCKVLNSKGNLNMTFVPFTQKGIRKSEAWSGAGKSTFVKVGETSEEKLSDYIQKEIINFFDGIEIEENGRDVLGFVTEYMKSFIRGEKTMSKEEFLDTFGREMYPNIELMIKEDPTKLHLLDPFPRLKKEILQKTDVKDLSGLGRLKSRGWL